MTTRFDSPLDLPCGVRVKNRFLKSAMSEVLATAGNDPTPAFAVLYGSWAAGGVGVQVTGNVMIDRAQLGEPNNVVLDETSDLGPFEKWAEAGRANGTQLWMQLNHPGRQSPGFLNKQPVAPSATPLGGSIARLFNPPRALSAPEIHELIERFAKAAELAQKAGFTGVQLHGAHGYLLSQFLSPLVNRRDDEWGGSPENRRRFVLEVYRAIRSRVGAAFPVSIKLNSADFQQGGFDEEESMAVVEALSREAIDLVEISGGTYEAPAMTAGAKKTRAREAYFLEFAEKVRSRLKVPLAVTGGFRSGAAMLAALESGATDLIGMARPFAVCPDFPTRLLANPADAIVIPRPSTGIRFVDRLTMLDVTFYETQLARMAKGEAPRPEMTAWTAAFTTLRRAGLTAFRPRRA